MDYRKGHFLFRNIPITLICIAQLPIMAGAEELRPDEPIIALDELQSDEALRHPLKLATETIAEARGLALGPARR